MYSVVSYLKTLPSIIQNAHLRSYFRRGCRFVVLPSPGSGIERAASS